jgi:hypothetical protein
MQADIDPIRPQQPFRPGTHGVSELIAETGCPPIDNQ